MPQHVRMDVDRQPLRESTTLQLFLDHARIDARAALADEQRRLARTDHLRTTLSPSLDRLPRLASNRDVARLAALAEYPDFSVRQVMQTSNVQRRQLGEAHTR